MKYASNCVLDILLSFAGLSVFGGVCLASAEALNVSRAEESLFKASLRASSLASLLFKTSFALASSLVSVTNAEGSFLPTVTRETWFTFLASSSLIEDVLLSSGCELFKS